MVSSDAQFDCYELLNTGHGADFSGQTGHWSEILGLRPKMGEPWRRFITDSTVNLLIFSTLTHTHDIDNHNNGYGHLKTADVRSSVDYHKTEPSTVWT
jgi:hypothetical protein